MMTVWSIVTDVETPAVVVKRGAKGFRVGRGGRFENYAAVQVRAIDTTGAGDALAAGFLVGGPNLAAQTAAQKASPAPQAIVVYKTATCGCWPSTVSRPIRSSFWRYPPKRRAKGCCAAKSPRPRS